MKNTDRRLIEDYLPIEAIREGVFGEACTKRQHSACSQPADLRGSSTDCCSAVKATN
jgi:hypothetical protein